MTAVASLASAFAASSDAVDGAEIDAALHRLIERARIEWPEGRTDQGPAITQQIAATLPATPPPSIAAYVDGLHAGDLAIACGCAHGVGAALVAFERRYGGLLREQAERIAHGPSHADDVAQIVRIRLLTGAAPKIAQYAGRAPLDRWLGVAARRAALDMQRAQANDAARPRRDEGLEVAIVGDDPELDHLRATYRVAFERAFGGALERLSPRERNLLRQVLLQRVRIGELARVHDVDRRTISRWLERAREQVLADVCEGLQRDLQISADEVGSVLRAVASRLELGLSQALRSRGALE